MPPAGQTVSIYAVVEDTASQTTTTSTVTVLSVSDPGTTVTGRVVDGSLNPIAGAQVTITPGGAAAITVTSGADGTFTAAGVPSGLGFLDVGATGTVGGCPAQGIYPLPVTPVPGGVTAIGNLTLSGPAASTTTVVGAVTDAGGNPLPGVPVTVYSDDQGNVATVVTGVGGVYSLPQFPARLWPLSVAASTVIGGVPQSGVFNGGLPAAGSTNLGVLALQPDTSGPDPLTTVVGMVIQQDGTPAAGAQVMVTAGAAVLLTTTANDGSFSIPGVPTVVTPFVGATFSDGCTFFNIGVPRELVPTPGGTTPAGTLLLGPDNGSPNISA
jgi:hypothetical protein